MHCYEAFLTWLGMEEADSAADGAVLESNNGGAQVMVAVAKTGEKKTKIPSQSYDVASNPGYGYRTVEDLITKFGAMDFIWHLDTFLTACSLPPIPCSYNAMLFPVFKQFSLLLPKIQQVSDLSDLKDTVRVVLPAPASGRQKDVEALFSTVLAVERPDVCAFEDLKHPLKGFFLFS